MRSNLIVVGRVLNRKKCSCMTQKQKTAAIIGIACLVVAFAFIYRQFAMQSGSWGSDASMSPAATVMPIAPAPKKADDTMMQKTETPTTPDNATDKVLDTLSADDGALDKEASAEADAAAESMSTIDDVTNAYDSTQN